MFGLLKELDRFENSCPQTCPVHLGPIWLGDHAVSSTRALVEEAWEFSLPAGGWTENNRGCLLIVRLRDCYSHPVSALQKSKLESCFYE